MQSYGADGKGRTCVSRRKGGNVKNSGVWGKRNGLIFVMCGLLGTLEMLAGENYVRKTRSFSEICRGASSARAGVGRYSDHHDEPGKKESEDKRQEIHTDMLNYWTQNRGEWQRDFKR